MVTFLLIFVDEQFVERYQQLVPPASRDLVFGGGGYFRKPVISLT